MMGPNPMAATRISDAIRLLEAALKDDQPLEPMFLDNLQRAYTFISEAIEITSPSKRQKDIDLPY